MKFTHATVPTLKEKPAEAEVASHELLLRAGMMRPLAAGIYTLLPLGALALARIEDVVRDEMNAAGACELILPTLQPSDAWEESGRWSAYGPEMMRLADRQGRDFCLAPTAEEVITLTVARIAPSYRDLPLNLYQIQTKFRDETRPRFGLLRGREFRMKDAYSFHADAADLDETYARMYEAYSAMARRCSLEVKVVEAATGLIGGDISHEFMVVSGIGEDVLVFCDSCDYGANAELESHRPSRAIGSPGGAAPEEVHTPDMTTIQDVAAFIGVTPEAVIKCVMYVADGEAVAAFVPGYREVSEPKLAAALRTDDFHPLREDERELFGGLTPGFTGPVGLRGVRVLYDSELAGGQGMVCGANRLDYHLRGVDEGRDFAAEPLADIAAAVAGDLCPRCEGSLGMARGIEIGHIFKLGLKYSEPLKAHFTDADGVSRPMVMGTYGIGTSRILQTVVEQHRDEKGICWPTAVAPLPVELIVLDPGNGSQAEAAARITGGLAERSVQVLTDERSLSPGIKFNDADLVGLPVQVVLGKKLVDGMVDLKIRHTGERRDVAAGDAVGGVIRALEEAP
ncbi:MAG: proline--tRNA ligase [Actinobacteria bacterium]|nr:proline--tRNA ligase [Actinomycetota bacterium]MBU2687343.1 proline--tRNA ligase [Actinomycetota bacterium]